MAEQRSETAPDQISAEWLTERLRRNGHLPQSEVCSVRVKSAHKHHFALEVAYSPEAPDTLPTDLILKWYGGGYRYGVREAFFYRSVAPAMPSAPVPRCFDADHDWETDRAHVLLEDLSATHLAASPPYTLRGEMWEQVVDAHLQVHSHWWDHPQLSRPDLLRVEGGGVAHEAISPEAIRRNEGYFVETALPARVDQWDAEFPSEWQPLCERAISGWADRFVERTARGTGLTLIQGDAQLGNLLLPRDPVRHRPVIIDWEGCTRGLGVWDLARTLIQTELPSDERMALEGPLLQRYQAGLEERGVQNYGPEDCDADYRLSVLANVPHALAWESPSYLASAIRAFLDWQCQELLH